MRILRTVCAGILLAGAVARAEDAPRVGAADEGAPRYEVDPETKAVTGRVGGRVCWTYHPGSEEGKPHFHPLCAPGTGDVLTGFRPADHRWHLGLWFSWKYINGVNFWEPDADAVCTVVRHEERMLGNTCQFIAEITYAAKGKDVLHEFRVTHVLTQEDGSYEIKFEAIYTALKGGVTFACTPAKRDADGIWASGGYAGLMLRFAPNPAGTYSFTDAEGRANGRTCGHASPWIEAAVALPGGTKARVRIIDHPDNPRYPNTWFSRHGPEAHQNTGYNLIGTGLVFHEPLMLGEGQALRLCYMVEVFKN